METPRKNDALLGLVLLGEAEKVKSGLKAM
jgi:hypothetical protein